MNFIDKEVQKREINRESKVIFNCVSLDVGSTSLNINCSGLFFKFGSHLRGQFFCSFKKFLEALIVLGPLFFNALECGIYQIHCIEYIHVLNLKFPSQW